MCESGNWLDVNLEEYQAAGAEDNTEPIPIKERIDMKLLKLAYDLREPGYILVPFSRVDPHQRIILGRDKYNAIIFGVVDNREDVSDNFQIGVREKWMTFSGYMLEPESEEILYIRNDDKPMEERVYGGKLPVGSTEMGFESLYTLFKKNGETLSYKDVKTWGRLTKTINKFFLKYYAR